MQRKGKHGIRSGGTIRKTDNYTYSVRKKEHNKQAYCTICASHKCQASTEGPVIVQTKKSLSKSKGFVNGKLKSKSSENIIVV